MLFEFLSRKHRQKAEDTERWRERWQSLVPEQCRNVPVTVGGRTRICVATLPAASASRTFFARPTQKRVAP